jgi:ABC-type transport system involved in cytochrome c biogenesis permease component
MASMVFRVIAVWLVFILAESAHGAVREIWLRPHVGDLRARQLALLTGSVIVLSIAYAFLPWIGAESRRGRWLVGVLWVALTVAFEFSVGRLVLGYSWDRVLEDYDPTRGGFLSLGMLLLLLSPHIAAKARGRRPCVPHHVDQ